MSDELKPCPFCGGEACYVDDIGMGVDEPTKEISCEHISCLPITVRVPISSWNARPIEDALRARAEAAEAENAKLRKVIVGMLPMWISAMGYCEHGKNSQLMFMRNYYNGRENKMTNEDIHLMFSVMPGKVSE